MLNYDLKTKYTDLLDKNNPLPEYPRPSFKRKSYKSLNGEWEYCINKTLDENFNSMGKIIVPFCLESKLSNVGYFLNKEEILIYRKIISFDEIFNYDHIILHFDSVMQISYLYINNKFVFKNTNGFLPFQVDIKEYIIPGENEILLKVENKPDYTYPTGKENVKRGGMWYTKTSGIYKSVWYEWFNSGFIEDVKLETTIDGIVKGNIISTSKSNHIKISFNEQIIKEFDCENSFEIQLNSPNLWSFDTPNLYNIEISNIYDYIESYFAFRKFEIIDSKFYLNNKECFINGLLDQGYFSDGIYTPSSYKAFMDDITFAKSLGFNALRKHIKIECDMFYYYADKLGILILQDFPNNGKYKFFQDSILPTIGIKKINKKANEETKIAFNEQGFRIIDMLKRHPSVVYYTIFNEGWGEFDSEIEYSKFKSYAPEYVFDTASGWFNQTKSDVLSIHNYFFKLKVPKSQRPVILSEYGGYNCKITNHTFNDSNDYGYHKCKDVSSLKSDLDSLFKTINELKEEGLAGAIYTQLSDVEDETNGLITYDREIMKYMK